MDRPHLLRSNCLQDLRGFLGEESHVFYVSGWLVIVIRIAGSPIRPSRPIEIHSVGLERQLVVKLVMTILRLASSRSAS